MVTKGFYYHYGGKFLLAPHLHIGSLLVLLLLSFSLGCFAGNLQHRKQRGRYYEPDRNTKWTTHSTSRSPLQQQSLEAFELQMRRAMVPSSYGLQGGTCGSKLYREGDCGPRGSILLPVVQVY